MNVRGALVVVALLLPLATACTLIDQPVDGHEVEKLMADYRTRTAAADAAAKSQAESGVRRLDVKGQSHAATVAVDLDRAPLHRVITDLLDRAHLPYLLRNTTLTGSVTARFEDVPVVDALNLLLSTRGLAAHVRAGVVIIEPGDPDPVPGANPPAAPRPMPEMPTPSPRPVPHGNPAASQGDGNGPEGQPGMPHGMPAGMMMPQGAPVKTVSVEIPLQWIDTETATSILSGLYPSGPQSTGPPPLVQYGIQPSTNTVFLVGEAGAVERTRALLQRADRESPHIMIEALVVEFDRNALERLETDIANGAFHAFSAIETNFGDLLREGLTFTRTAGAHNATAFSLLVDYLAAQDKARLVSRPYIATYSGEQAVINITSNRYVLVQTAQQGATVTTPAPVSSGVTLTITPTATTDGLIRTVMQVTDSQFVPTTENVAVEVDQNQASTTMVVEDGQSIIIGGLVLDRRSTSNSGVPGLRDLPVLNLLFANRSASRAQQEVFVVLTPHVWRPGMSIPLVQPKVFTPGVE